MTDAELQALCAREGLEYREATMVPVTVESQPFNGVEFWPEAVQMVNYFRGRCGAAPVEDPEPDFDNL